MLSTDFERMKTALTEVPYSIDDFEIDARLPAAGQLKIFAHYGWLDGPPSPLYVQRRMVQLARERYERALASAKRLHPGKTVTFPMTFAEFEKARSWEAGSGFYFSSRRGAAGRGCGNRTILCATRTWTRLTSSNTKRALGARMKRIQPASSRRKLCV